MKCSETSAYKIQTPGNFPEENIQNTEHGESLKPRMGPFYSSGRKGENDHNIVAPNLVDPIVVDPNILDDNLLHFIAVVQSELSKFRTATSGTSNCSVHGSSSAVKVNAFVASRQQYHLAHS
jgi:hypothetical protein